MKIVAGLGSVQDYIPYVKAGADELFCGYVPHSWMENEGIAYPLNRREVLYYNVQIGSESEMEILAELVKIYKVPVTITLNNLLYAPHQYSMLGKLVGKLSDMGFRSFIVGDMALLVYLKQNVKEDISIHISGEMSEVNHHMISHMKELGAKRIIFHRKVTPAEMKDCIENDTELEYEAFAMNEKCHFTGAFCSCLHCDELAPSCRLPYRLVSLNDTEGRANESAAVCEGLKEEYEAYVPGESGCGLCALERLRAAGVTYLKLVSRGNYTEDTIKDIKLLKEALSILESASGEEEYIRRMKKKIFPKGCSKNCYYPM